ncbi:histidine kinase [Microbacterium sp. HD4P20]|uniref:sensor histidine kinase n=1 Tax=Microbacterium sp. HD4P20 TaxID=2864874 RepID=UPI001C63D9AD|nr:histidine kinase [Microbacterium sp. HD4P20]MCP2637180.1 histidine kinase [Microbacterium sp. HD4P20]
MAASATWRRVAERLSPAAGRTRGEWATDAALFGTALLVGWVMASPGVHPQILGWWWPWDIALGAFASASIWWTRRYPLTVGVLLIVPGAVSITAMVGALVAVYRMGLLAPIRWALLVTTLHVLAALPYHAVAPLPGMTWLVWLIVVPLMYALTLCIGLLGRARRQLIVGLRESAARDRERYEERLSTTRRDERERIAREMHDVLAHRISLLSMHAGALEYRASSPHPPDPRELHESAGVIRSNAQGAVEDLRELLGLLRSDDELGVAAPQPRLTDLERLLNDAAAAGQQVDFDSDARPERLRETTQRAAYRVVQEALTNARKHAPAAPVTVRLRQDRSQLTIVAANPVPPGVTRWDVSPDGNGLVGLEERVRIEGGWFRAGVEQGEFRVVAELPVGSR